MAGLARLSNILRLAYHRLFDHGRPEPSQVANFEFNRSLWDRYARRWQPTRKHALVPSAPVQEPPCSLVGDEWGTLELPTVLDRYVWPNVNAESVVVEIGSGGGRLASRVAGRVAHLYCLDVSKEMLTACRAALAKSSNVTYVLLEKPRFPDELSGAVDFVYAFGVFVHLDLHIMWKYFQEIHRVLKPGRRAFLHTANLKAPLGWQRFASQERFAVPDFYFVSPEIIGLMAEHAGLTIIADSQGHDETAWDKRDYLVLLQK